MLAATGVSRAQLEAEGRRLVRHYGKQVLLMAAGGRIFAIANRFQHEGYPLSEGTLGPGCVLRHRRRVGRPADPRCRRLSKARFSVGGRGHACTGCWIIRPKRINIVPWFYGRRAMR